MLNKPNFPEPKIEPVEIRILGRRNLLGFDTGEFYGQISFWLANQGWFDHEIFHKIVNKRFVPNKKGIEVGIKLSSGGGSAFLEFKPEKINEVIKYIEEHGYKTLIIKE